MKVVRWEGRNEDEMPNNREEIFHYHAVASEQVEEYRVVCQKGAWKLAELLLVSLGLLFEY